MSSRIGTNSCRAQSPACHEPCNRDPTDDQRGEHEHQGDGDRQAVRVVHIGSPSATANPPRSVSE